MGWIPVEDERIKTNRQKIYASYLRHRNLLVLDGPIRIKWKISEFRKDKRTGATSCKRMSGYAKKQYKDAMRKWSL